MRTRSGAWGVAVALGVVCGVAGAQQPKDEDVAQSVSQFQRLLVRPGQDIGAAEAERTRIADEILDHYGVDRLTAAQLLRLAQVVGFSSRQEAVIARLERMVQGTDSDGALASVALVRLRPAVARRGPESVKDLETALRHPGFRKAVTSAAVDDIFIMLILAISNRADAAELLQGDLVRVFEADLPLAAIKSLSTFISAIEGADLPDATEEPLRLAMLGAIKRWRKMLSNDQALMDYAISMGNTRMQVGEETLRIIRAQLAGDLDQHARKLEGSFGGRGVGKPAPELSIRWAAGRDGGSEIGDFKGRIVVLVHWYRWPGGEASAGLCKELADRYAGKPVEVIAVTTFLAGALHGNGAVIDPGGTRDQQAAMARATAAAAGLTMPVGFADSHGLSTMYGIRMSGQVAVIDAAGIVRGVGMSGDDQGKRAIFELIDGLLKEPTAAEPARTAPEPEARLR